jgi:hypothetical protein
MLQDNYRALSLTKKMGFKIEYLSDGTVKGELNLKDEDIDLRCLTKNEPEPVQEKKQSKTEAKAIIQDKKLSQEAAST